jgi:small-conductance mechanosensitive channel
VGLVTLVTWGCTVMFGLYMLLVWLIEYDPTGRDTAASKLRAPIVFTHFGLAAVSLLVWAGYLLTNQRRLAWIAVGGLTLIALLGVFMFARWIPVHRGDRYERPYGGQPGRPPESHFPEVVVASHGVLAVTTYILVLLTTLNVHFR